MARHGDLNAGHRESVFFAVVDEGLGRPVEFVGVLGAVQRVGAIVAGVATTAVIHRTGEPRPAAWAFAVMSLGVVLTMSSSLLVVATGTLLFGAGLPVLIVCLTTTIQRRTPGELQGRTFTAFELFSGVPQLLSILTGAVLVTLVDYRIPLLVMAVGIAAAGVYSALRLRDDEAPSELADLPAVHVDLPVGVYLSQQPPVVTDEQQRPVVGR